MHKHILKRRLNVAKGKESPDAVIKNGKLLNVFTNSIDEGLDIILKDGWIVSVENAGRSHSQAGVNVIDADRLDCTPVVRQCRLEQSGRGFGFS